MIYELINPGYVNIPASYPHPSHSQHHQHHNQDSNNQLRLEVNDKKLNERLFSANVKFQGEEFVGYGKTAPEARHQAAEKALNFLKDNFYRSMAASVPETTKNSYRSTMNTTDKPSSNTSHSLLDNEAFPMALSLL